MAINWSNSVYLPTYEVFARPVTITPIASQPLQPAYTARGIYATVPIDIIGQDGMVFSDQRTILDVRDAEFAVVPIQLDRITIPEHNGMPALGTFEIIDADANGGGETTLTIRKVVSPPLA